MTKRFLSRMSAANIWSYIILVVFITAYAVTMLVEPGFGPNDDFWLLSTLQVGQPAPVHDANFPFYDARETGRFIPLTVQELNIIARLFGTDPFWYFAFNALQLLVVIVLLVAMLRRVAPNAIVVAVAIVLLMLTPGFVEAWFRMALQERNVFFYLTLFLFFYWLDRESAKWWKYALALLSANVALYYKEPVFAAIGAFAGASLLFRWRYSSTMEKLKDAMLILSAVMFIALYIDYAFPHHGPWGHSSNPYPYWLVLTKTVLNYAFFSDPVVVLLVLPLTLWRFYVLVTTNGREIATIYDSMLFAASGYALVFFALNFYGSYYFVPTYVFATPAVLYFMPRLIMSSGRYWKAASVIVAIVLMVNTLPAGLQMLTYTKYVIVNLDKTVDFLVSDIPTRGRNERMNIFLYGVEQGSHAYFILGEFLKYKDLPYEAFDLRSDLAARCSPRCYQVLRPELARRYTVYHEGKLPEVQVGDYLVVSSWSEKDFFMTAAFEKQYKLLFRTNSPLHVPGIDLKSLVKRVIIKRMGDSAKSTGLVVHARVDMDPDYHVYVRTQ